jgi:hypothetical protein
MTEDEKNELLKTIDINVGNLINDLNHSHAIRMEDWGKDVVESFQTRGVELAKSTVTPRWFMLVNSIVNGVALGLSFAIAMYLMGLL